MKFSGWNPDCIQNCCIIENFACLESLAETCKLDDSEQTGLSRLSLKPGTIRRLSNNVSDSSEACQEQCEVILLGDETPKEKTLQRQSVQCSCFCFYHQECLPQQPTGSICSQLLSQLLSPCNTITTTLFLSHSKVDRDHSYSLHRCYNSGQAQQLTDPVKLRAAE